MKNKNILKLICFVLALLLSIPSAYAFSLSDAQKYYLNGDYEGAIEKAKALRENDEVLYFLGLSYIKIAEYAKARIYLRRLIRGFSDSRLFEQGLVKLADTYFLQKDYTKALRLYEEIRNKYSTSVNMPLVLLRLAQIASRQGNWEDKSNYLKLIKTKYPKSSVMKFVKVLEGYEDFFTIQVGAFSERQNALSLTDELKEKKYKAYIIEETKGKYPIHKVRVGRYKNRYDAQKIRAKLLDEGYSARIHP